LGNQNTYLPREISEDSLRKNNNIWKEVNVSRKSFDGDITWYQKSQIGGKNSVTNTVRDDSFDEQNNPLSDELLFFENSILCKTQSLMTDSTVGQAINQTNRYFKDQNQTRIASRPKIGGTPVVSKGNAVKPANAETGTISDEFCRVWTKNYQYDRLSKMVRAGHGHKSNTETSGLMIKRVDTVLNENGLPRISPTFKERNNGKLRSDLDFKEISNLNQDPKRYMFSIENLAWVNAKIFLPPNEIGQFGGRLMWFPPYDLTFNEQNNANWNETMFVGRPEPIYTYNNATRNGTLSFKVVVDHPSILNELVHYGIKNNNTQRSVSDEEILSFISGCHEYSLDKLSERYKNIAINELADIQ